MPLYNYDCPKCGSMQTDMRLIINRDMPKKCTCGVFMKRRMEVIGGIFVDMPGAPHEGRSDEYWARAERVKQKKKKKRNDNA